MSSFKMRETFYVKESKNDPFQPFKRHSQKKKKASLDELYREVHAYNALRVEEVYRNKNAKEIESMMIQNRRLIESKRSMS